MVDAIETLAKGGALHKALVFVFTDNYAAEAAVNKGNFP